MVDKREVQAKSEVDVGPRGVLRPYHTPEILTLAAQQGKGASLAADMKAAASKAPRS